MKPLFEMPKSEKKGMAKAQDRIHTHLQVALTEAGFDFEKAKKGEHWPGTLLHIFKKSKPEKSLKVYPWVRPDSMTQKELMKALSNYPRLNIPTDLKMLPKEECLKSLMRIFDDVHFLVMLPRPRSEAMFWFGRYRDIPKWEFIYRREKGSLDVVGAKKGNARRFVNIQQLEEQLKKTIKNEGKSRKVN